MLWGRGGALEPRSPPHLNPRAMFNKGRFQGLSFPIGTMGIIMSIPSRAFEERESHYT